MPSYLSYMRQMAVLDADDNEIESWITVRGNHIPIKKGQSKEDAVKSFIESKGGKYKKESYGKHYVKTGEKGDEKYVDPRTDTLHREKSKVGFFGSEKEAKEYAEKLNHTDPYAGTPFAVKNYTRTKFPYNVESEENEEKKGGSGGRINTNIDPNREKAGKTKYDPSDDFATQLYKNKKSKGDYTIAHKDKSGNTAIIAEVSHKDVNSGESDYDKDEETKEFATKYLKRAMNGVGKEKWGKMAYAEKTEAIKKEKDYYRTEGRNLYFDTEKGYGIRTDDPEFEKQFFEEYPDADKEDFKDYVKGFNGVGMTNEDDPKPKNADVHNDKGLYQDALNELDDQIADKEKELENIHLSMTENAEAGYFDIASANMEDIEFVKGQLEELKKKREKLAGSSGTKAPKVTKVDAKKWNSPASDPWKSLYD